MKQRSRLRKARSLILKAIGAVIIAIGLFLASVFSINLICNHLEQGKIKPYGQYVLVDGHRMNVTIQGEGKETVVLLPGYGTASPALDFKPLVDELAPFYKVVVVEPFGYGLSDVTDKERSIDNIVSEIHEALQRLHVDRYILMGHSIAGIYGLDYVNRYENEVSAFVGIDSSVPAQGDSEEAFPAGTYKLLKQSGFYRLLLKLNPGVLVTPTVDKAAREQIRMITLKNLFNRDILSEGEHFKANFQAVKGLTFPKNLPLLFLLQENDNEVEGWIPLHEQQIKDSLHGKVMTFEGSHYLHHTRSKEIAQNFRAFMSGIPDAH